MSSSASSSSSSGQRIRKTFYMYKRTIWVIVIWFIISKTLHMGEHLFHVFTLWSCLSSSPITDSTATMIRNKKNQWQNSTPPPPRLPSRSFFPSSHHCLLFQKSLLGNTMATTLTSAWHPNKTHMHGKSTQTHACTHKHTHCCYWCHQSWGVDTHQ